MSSLSTVRGDRDEGHGKKNRPASISGKAVAAEWQLRKFFILNRA